MPRKKGDEINPFTRQSKNQRSSRSHSSALIKQNKNNLLNETILEEEAVAEKEVAFGNRQERQKPKTRTISDKVKSEAGLFKGSSSARLTEDELKEIRSQGTSPASQKDEYDPDKDDDMLKAFRSLEDLELDEEEEKKEEKKVKQNSSLFKHKESFGLKEKQIKGKGRSLESFDETEEYKPKGPK